MISEILKTKCPLCNESIYPEYLKDSAERTCPHCGKSFPVTFKAVIKARALALSCFFVFPVFVLGLTGEEALWMLPLCVLVGFVGYGKLTSYRLSMPSKN